MNTPWRCALLLTAMLCAAKSPPAQLPFYTDDPAVTAPGVLHFEFFNEFDGLQSSQFPICVKTPPISNSTTA